MEVDLEMLTLVNLEVSVSDSCSAGKRQDHSGHQLNTILCTHIDLHAEVCEVSTVTDDISNIREKLLEWTDKKHLDLILTTGGTGFSARDVTPEATKSVIEKEAIGISTAILVESLKLTPMAMLSRAVCGIRKQTLIVNLPGSAKASQECLSVILPVLRHAVDLLRERIEPVTSAHEKLQQADPAQHHKYSSGSSSKHEGHQHRTNSSSNHDHTHSIHDHSHGSHDHTHSTHQKDHSNRSQNTCHKHVGSHGDHHGGVQKEKISCANIHHDSRDSGKHCCEDHNHHDSKSASESVDLSSSKASEFGVARRPRHSPYPMISVQDALNKVMEHAEVKGTEWLFFDECIGRILAENVQAKEPLPPFPASIKDGYAVLASDGVGLRIVLGGCTAGDVPERSVRPGSCIRISTGAPIPSGADAVVQVEDTKLIKTTEDGREELEIEILEVPKVGQDIRPTGSDITQDEQILAEGCLLGASEIGLLATVGVSKVLCHQLPVVGVMSTGNELLEPKEELKPGMIRDSNRIMLMSLLKQYGFIVKDLGIATDSSDSLRHNLKSALNEVDVVVTSGGVSMGERDLMKEVLQVDLLAQLHFARVHMKPGKPTTFATLDLNGKKKLFFGLPGNPVSAAVTCHLYVLPALRKMAGHPRPHWSVVKAKLSSDVKLDPRPEYHRCVLFWEPDSIAPVALSTGNQISSRLMSMRGSNALLVLPALAKDKTSLNAGDLVDALVIGHI